MSKMICKGLKLIFLTVVGVFTIQCGNLYTIKPYSECVHLVKDISYRL
jgi:hypothetical protein